MVAGVLIIGRKHVYHSLGNALTVCLRRSIGHHRRACTADNSVISACFLGCRKNIGQARDKMRTIRLMQLVLQRHAQILIIAAQQRTKSEALEVLYTASLCGTVLGIA